MTQDSLNAERLPLDAQRRNTDIASAADHLQSDLFHLGQMLENYSDDEGAILLGTRVADASRRLESIWRRRDALDSSAADSEFDVRTEESETIKTSYALRDEGIDLLTQLQAALTEAAEREPQAAKAAD